MPFLPSQNSLIGRHKTLVLIVLIVLLFFTVCFLIYKQVKTSRQIHNEQLAARIDTVIQYKTLEGKIAYRVYEKKVTDQRVKDSLMAVLKNMKIRVQEAEKIIVIKEKADYSLIKASARDTVYLDKDSVTRIGKYGEYRDGYIDIAALITDSLHFSRLQTIDTLTGVFHRTVVGGNVFNKLTVTNKSPYNKIVGLEDISIKQPPEYRRWGIGASASWDFIANKPSVGIGINYNLIQFRKKPK